MTRWHAVIFVGLILIAASSSMLATLLSAPGEPLPLSATPAGTTGDETAPIRDGERSLVITDQDAGRRFFIQEVQTDRASWAVVYGENSTKPLGAFFFPHYNGVQSGGGALWEPLTSGGRYRAVLHEDDGDMSFHIESDPPLLDEAGRPVQTEFSVR